MKYKCQECNQSFDITKFEWFSEEIFECPMCRQRNYRISGAAKIIVPFIIITLIFALFYEISKKHM
jgi:Zn finger protein HypA/HybF involved in hydrogenase expression